MTHCVNLALHCSGISFLMYTQNDVLKSFPALSKVYLSFKFLKLGKISSIKWSRYLVRINLLKSFKSLIFQIFKSELIRFY